MSYISPYFAEYQLLENIYQVLENPRSSGGGGGGVPTPAPSLLRKCTANKAFFTTEQKTVHRRHTVSCVIVRVVVGALRSKAPIEDMHPPQIYPLTVWN